MINIYEIVGIIGFIFILLGIILRKQKEEHIFFIIGGIFLIFYSYSLNSYIFVLLQISFIIASLYELIRYDFKK